MDMCGSKNIVHYIVGSNPLNRVKVYLVQNQTRCNIRYPCQWMKRDDDILGGGSSSGFDVVFFGGGCCRDVGVCYCYWWHFKSIYDK